jgi:predicted dehydrogenase
MPSRFSRRHFLKSSAAAAAALSAGSFAFGAPRKKKEQAAHKYSATNPSPYRGLNVAFIGVGGRGASDFQEIASLGVNVVGLCDTDIDKLVKPAFEYPQARTWTDYRRMFAEQPNIDAVVIATPDHHHAIAALDAIRLGKHVYCEKPLTYNVSEARTLLNAARQYKVMTQMGNQGHASEGSRVQVECVKSGMIGTVKEVHICTDRPIWPQGMQELPSGTPFIPETLRWDTWLGPAPYRDFNPAYQPFKWRGWWDYGTGALGDMGCHLMDAPYWALDLKEPTSVEAQSESNSQFSPPKWSIITYEFPERNGRAPVKVVWYDGGKLPSEELTPNFKRPDKNNYMIYVGTNGTLCAPLNKEPQLVGDKKIQYPAKSIPRSVGHHEEFLIACTGGAPAGSNFEYSVPLTEMVLLGNLAIRTGKKVIWDSANLKADSAEAQQYVTRTYRQGWEI